MSENWRLRLSGIVKTPTGKVMKLIITVANCDPSFCFVSLLSAAPGARNHISIVSLAIMYIPSVTIRHYLNRRMKPAVLHV